MSFHHQAGQKFPVLHGRPLSLNREKYDIAANADDIEEQQRISMDYS
jgi:hypothetical protein